MDWKKITAAEWKQRLGEERYRVLRESGTEAAFSGELLDQKDDGTYMCAGCGAKLFHSKEKFDSGSGWPSVTDAVAVGSVVEVTDDSHGMIRTEVRCATCDGHLGHVFPDGPTESGMRYCINSASLEFSDDD